MTVVQSAIFISGLTLLLNIWITKQSGLTINPRDSQDVWRCMQTLSVCEKRWHVAGKLWDILSEIASAGDLDIGAHVFAAEEKDKQKQKQKKRPRESASVLPNPTGATHSPASSTSTPPSPPDATPAAYAQSLQQFAMQANAAAKAYAHDESLVDHRGFEQQAEMPGFSDEQLATFNFMNGYMNGQYTLPADFGLASPEYVTGSTQDYARSGTAGVYQESLMGFADGAFGSSAGSSGVCSGGLGASPAAGMGASPSGMGTGAGLDAGVHDESANSHSTSLNGGSWGIAPSPFQTDAWQRYLSASHSVDDFVASTGQMPSESERRTMSNAMPNTWSNEGANRTRTV